MRDLTNAGVTLALMQEKTQESNVGQLGGNETANHGAIPLISTMMSVLIENIICYDGE